MLPFYSFGSSVSPRGLSKLAQIVLVGTFGLLALPLCADSPAPSPWRLSQALKLPAWLHVSGSHRTRYETLDNQFRSGRQGGDQMIALRTLILTKIKFKSLALGLELADSRAALDDVGSPLNTTMINPAEVLQVYLALDTSSWTVGNDTSELRLGRLTLDVGSRRFVARSKYRNTINTFTGFEWQWRGQQGNQLQLFYTLPVNRKPNRLSDLINNAIEFDEEDTEVRFWGAYYRFAKLAYDLNAEVFILGLDENDAGRRRSRNRELYTPGFRLWQAKAPGQFDFILESALQFGEVRGSTRPSDVRDLDHFAHFEHFELGYTVRHLSRLRINLDFDYASGDDQPGDGDSGRFDTLFGARRFDFGPTGIYGPFVRSNLLSPGVRLHAKLSQSVALMMSYRGFWLASDRDAWPAAGVRDGSGASGNFIAQQLEARLRWDALPGNCRLEAGVAGLFDGQFARNAPNRGGQGDAFYGYTQVGLTF